MFERFTEEARAVVVMAQENARQLGHSYIGTEHLLLGLLDRPQTLAARLLAEHGLDKKTAEQTFLGMAGVSEDDEIDAEALGAIGIDLDAVRRRVEATFGPGALEPRGDRRSKRRKTVTGHIPFTRRSKKALELALREAQRLHHNYIADGHLLLGLLREGNGIASQIIVGAGIDPKQLREEIDAQLPPDFIASTG
ncbi:Clp protease N-terminal domain-containing protein [Nakamurella lactea]|uniref:Clp protease N-terminal domain-containing protein n=1 Tax=Nakamurella lactea TaxID=459515 RepID=UPI000427F4AA|nr:Clp protease N-terminal domain-containing protein [Nakamurella lactea]